MKIPETSLYSHICFADESCWNTGRYRSISLVTAEVNDAREMHRKLDELRKIHKTSEFKWQKIKKKYGLELNQFVLRNKSRIRIDVLIWDIEDSRHAGVKRRDDDKNFARMYYHLLRNVLTRRHRSHSTWAIVPDEKEGVDWGVLGECLYWKAWKLEQQYDHELGFREYYNIKEIRPSPSVDMVLVQLADVFAGMGAYSYAQNNKVRAMLDEMRGQTDLFTVSGCVEYSRTDRERIPIIIDLYMKASEMGLSLRLEETKGLQTLDPKRSNINFWLYRPQHDYDKAPVK